MGRAAYGVKGIELEDGRRGGGARGGAPGGTVLTVTEQRLRQAHRRSTSTGCRAAAARASSTSRPAGRNGPVVGVKFLRGDEGVMLITEKGMIIRLEHGGHLDHRPQHPGRAPDPARGGRPPGVGGPAGRARRRRREPGRRPAGPGPSQGGAMRERGASTRDWRWACLGLGLACSSGERSVVDQYFNALKANDQHTLTSFAAVNFDQKVDAWKIIAEGPEEKAPATLPDLVKKAEGAGGRARQEHEGRAHLGQRHQDLPRPRQGAQRAGEGREDPGRAPADRRQVGGAPGRGPRLKKAVAEAKAAVEPRSAPSRSRSARSTTSRA